MFWPLYLILIYSCVTHLALHGVFFGVFTWSILFEFATVIILYRIILPLVFQRLLTLIVIVT